MQHNIEATGLMSISPAGDIHFAKPDKNGSHTASIRRDIEEVERLICAMTGWTIEDLRWNKTILGAKWIKDYTGALDNDVFRLMNEPQITGWWRLHWHNRDENLMPLLSRSHWLATRQSGKYKARIHTKDKYIRLHLVAFNEMTYQHRQLEDSYAKLF